MVVQLKGWMTTSNSALWCQMPLITQDQVRVSMIPVGGLATDSGLLKYCKGKVRMN